MEGYLWIRMDMLNPKMSLSSVTLAMVWLVPKVSLVQKTERGTRRCPSVSG